MPTWRKFHVKTTDSLDLNDMPDDFTRLMWCLLPLKSCRHGRGIDLPQWVMSQLFPLRSDVTLDQVESAMRWYHDRRMIRRYVIGGRPYYQIENWQTYQGNTDREAASSFPAPRKDSDVDIDVYVDGHQKTNSGVSQELVRTGDDKPVLHGGSHYELTQDEAPNADRNEKRRVMVSAISGVVKDTCAIGVNSDQFEQVADALIDTGADVDSIKRFSKWWKSNGHYDGKPALKSLLQNYKASQPIKADAPVGLTEAQIKGRNQP